MARINMDKMLVEPMVDLDFGDKWDDEDANID